MIITEVKFLVGDVYLVKWHLIVHCFVGIMHVTLSKVYHKILYNKVPSAVLFERDKFKNSRMDFYTVFTNNRRDSRGSFKTMFK